LSASPKQVPFQTPSLLRCYPSTDKKFWSKAYNITSEVADAVVEVANAMPVKRSIKAIANNSPWFLVILMWVRNSCNFITLYFR
jgi:hypothetical protein